MTHPPRSGLNGADVSRMAQVSIVPLFVLLAIALVAFVAARVGWRWRRVIVPPTCRRCGYDVSHRPAGVERCSECGANLTRPRAILTERRVVNRWLAVPATLAGAVALLMFASAAISYPYGTWFRAHAPISWIQSLARRDYGPAGDRYRAAWQARASGDGYIDHLLDLQGDATTTLRPGWGNDLGDAFAVESMNIAQRDRYLRQMFGPTVFRVRSPVRAQDPLLVEATLTTRGDPRRRVIEQRTLAASVDAEAALGERFWSRGASDATAVRAIASRDWAGAGVAPGRHRMNVKLRRQAYQMKDDHAYGPAIDAEVTLDVDVLPAEAPIGTPVPAPEQADAVARAVAVGVYHWHDGRCFAEVRLLAADVDRSFSVYATIDGVETRIGGACAQANAEATTNAIYVPLSVERARTTQAITIALVGDGGPLAESIDQQRYWPGRIVYADVPLGSFEEYVAGAHARAPRLPTMRPYRIEQAAQP